MFTHNLDPILFNFGFFAIRWYSLAYIAGILIGWWYGKKIILSKSKDVYQSFDLNEFDNLISYIVVSLIIGGRLGYVLFYNLDYYLSSPIDIFKIWKGGMSFHGALIGIVIGTYIFALQKKINSFFLLDIIACVSPIGIFLGRIANFINGELVGKTTTVMWGVIFPKVDMMPRHPSQLYEAFLEGIVLFIIIRTLISKKDYIIGTCSWAFLFYYGIFRIISEIFREPDSQIGYLFNSFSIGTCLSIIMILAGLIIRNFLNKKNEIQF